MGKIAAPILLKLYISNEIYYLHVTTCVQASAGVGTCTRLTAAIIPCLVLQVGVALVHAEF